MSRKNSVRSSNTARQAAGHEEKSTGDQGLGMEAGITRRDFLNGTLLGSGALLLNAASPVRLLAATAATDSADEWTGNGGVGDYAHSNGNTAAVLGAGHQIRDGLFEDTPANVMDTGETYDCDCGWRHQRAGGGADFSTQGWGREDVPCTRQSSHLRRRGETQ